MEGEKCSCQSKTSSPIKADESKLFYFLSFIFRCFVFSFLLFLTVSYSYFCFILFVLFVSVFCQVDKVVK